MESRSVSFFSEGIRLAGDLFLPDGLKPGERRAGIVLCHGYTGVRNLYLPDIARVLTEAGYVVLTFDYKGWGDSEGPKSRLAPYSRVIDVQAALTWLGAQDMVDAERLGIYGTSYGGATVVWVAAVDPRVKVRGLGGRRRQRPALDAQRAAARRVSRSARTIRGGPGQARDGGTVGIRRTHRHPDARSSVGGTGRGGASRQSRRGQRDPAGVRRRYTGLQRRMGGGQDRAATGAVHHQRTTTGWCRRRKARRCTGAPARSEEAGDAARLRRTTRCTPAKRSAR